jgi:tRNA pseudouridine13 synthase
VDEPAHIAFDAKAVPRACGPPVTRALVKQYPEDFQVDEILGFIPEGQGCHAFLKIRKRGMNTDWLAGNLARLAGVGRKSVGYAGMKDRHAVTTQWFSIDLSGQVEPDWHAMESPEMQVLEATRHTRKLRTGAHSGNRFTLRLRELQGDCEDIDSRFRLIEKRGAPNYFGSQRFGRNAGNLERARAMFRGEIRVRDRKKRGLYLSAARSWLFNKVLAKRVERDDWDRPVAGDVMVLDGSRSFFRADSIDEELLQRVSQRDIHPSGPLFGAGEPLSGGDIQILEDAVAGQHPEYLKGLEKAGLRQERRPLRIIPADLCWSRQEDGNLCIEFALPAGAYATTILAELIHGV